MQSGFVDAIAESAGRRAIVEQVAEMGVAQAAQDFGAVHEETVVGLGVDVFGGQGRGVAGPAGAGVKLGGGTEEGVATADAAIESHGFGLKVGAGEGCVGGAAARGPILLRGELAAPVAIGMGDLFPDYSCGLVSTVGEFYDADFNVGVAVLRGETQKEGCESTHGEGCDD